MHLLHGKQKSKSIHYQPIEGFNMNTTMKNIRKTATALTLVASAGFVFAAGSATQNIAVSTTITAKCTISTTAVAFGDYDPITGNDVTTNGTVVVGCTKASTGLWVGLGEGAHYASGTRNLNGAASSDKLAYSLMQPTSNDAGSSSVCPAFGAGTPWANDASTALNLSSPTSYATRTYKVCGQLAKAQDKSVDTYADTVVATINF